MGANILYRSASVMKAIGRLFTTRNEKRTVRKTVSAITWTVLLSTSMSICRPAAWKNELKANITSAYSLCKIGLDFNTISRPGTLLEIQKDGIDGDVASNVTVSVTLIEDGQPRPETGGLPGLLRNEKTTRTFKVGEQVCLHEVFVRNDHALYLDFISHDKFVVSKNGTTEQVRYKGILRFEFPREYLPSASFKEVKAAIESVVAPKRVPASTGAKPLP